MNRLTTIFARSFATVLSLALVNISIPMGGMTHLAPDPNAPKPAPAPVKPKPKASRVLTAKESKTLQGRLGKNPYLAGQNKWDVVYQGINLMSGNFSASGTDLTFEGGYGVPVNVTRSYSANNMDEGPLGEGWTLSVDIRNTAGGLLKSSGAPVRSVPVSFKERPAVVNGGDPRIPDANEPVEAVIATDAGGLEETIQKDADGILTTPSWDKNRNISEYETVTVGTALYQILKRNIVTTPEGTVYVYEKKGEYTNGGMVPWDDDEATPTPANVLKIVSVTDRHGNVTSYTYGTSNVTFTKSNGTTSEKPLESIEMPNGHEIEFIWGNGTNAPTNRIRTASDGVRTVTYGYTNSLLTSVQTPGGKTTSYGYGSTATAIDPIEAGSASNLLVSVTDPRGLVTEIGYYVDVAPILPYSITKSAVRAYKVIRPNGTATFVRYHGSAHVADSWFYVNDSSGALVPYASYVDVKGMGVNDVIHYGSIVGYAYQNAPTFAVTMNGNEAVTGAWTNNSTNFQKFYDVNSQNLLDEVSITGLAGGDLSSQRRFATHSIYGKAIWSTTTYNFMGNPLEKTVYEKNSTSLENVANWTNVRTATIGYAYWGREKYYQQKAVKDQAGRASFTDYFDWNADQGKKGQTYRVFDEKRANFSDKNDSQWRYLIAPTSSTAYSAEFDYDAKGRPTDIWKIQKTTTSPWTYVQTKTTYGSDGAPTWGAATQVVEDYGSGKINRTTNTLAYDSIGRAVEVQDASGKVFETNYDLDGVVQSVYRTDSSLNQMIVGYSYGTTGLLNGMVTQVVDGLSGVTQDFTYETIGGGKGQVGSVTETNGADSYSTSYSYNAAGERETAVYVTPNGTTSYKYSDYVQVGNAASPSRVFQTLNKTVSGTSTSEEFHYRYDSSGRLLEAAFAQTPQSGGGAPTSAPYYTNSYPADTRARAYYTYDPAGRVTNVEHYWDQWNGSSYGTPTKIVGNHCDYELSGSNRGLKTANEFYVKHSSTNDWVLQRTENYSYDADLDYLTSADYNDGLANENPSWSYDAAGNRNDASVVDNLNRATTIGGVSRTYDILGNTLTKGSDITYTWDALNRMTMFSLHSATVEYQYRADGMRVKKSAAAGPTMYYYDGQMPVENAEIGISSTVVTRNTLGARGIDRIERVGSSTTVGYPLYDGHGNMVATLAKSGSGFSVNDQRSYDAWGVIRSGNTTGEPKGRFVASLGHVADDESGLTYMRLRYYDGSSGRFLNQDPERKADHWYLYACNNPVNLVDFDGAETEKLWDILTRINAKIGRGLTIAGTACMWAAEMLALRCYTAAQLQGVIVMAKAAVVLTFLGSLCADIPFGPAGAILAEKFLGGMTKTLAAVEAAAANASVGSKTAAGKAVLAAFAYQMTVASFVMGTFVYALE